jgi:hypothetical protein
MLGGGEVDGLRYFSFEYVDGVDLRHLLRGAPLPRTIAVVVSRAVVEARCAASTSVGFDGRTFEFCTASWPHDGFSSHARVK